MILRWYGHDWFTLTLENGKVIATDPHAGLSYPEPSLRADVCTVSHHHYDHDAVSKLRGSPMVIDRPGRYHPLDGVEIVGVETAHDDAGGQKRGQNVVFSIRAEGLNVVHLGDLGHLLDQKQRSALGSVDVLLVPVGGTYTIDAKQAVEQVGRLRPKVAVPMHYQTAGSKGIDIADETEFLRLMDANPERVRLLRLTSGDIGQRPNVMVFETPVK